MLGRPYNRIVYISPAFPLSVLSIVLASQVRYPDRITLIRGNHESRQITQVRGRDRGSVAVGLHAK